MTTKPSNRLTIIGLMLFIFSCVFIISHYSMELASADEIAHLPQPVRQTMTIAPDGVQSVSYEFTAAPGRLTGYWIAQGPISQIGTPSDDTLAAFELIGPSNQVIQNLDQQASGTIDLKIKSPGRFTFVLDNRSIPPTGDRTVIIRATYRAD